MARTLPFQGGEAGSIPVDSTNICSGAGNWKTGNVENVVTQEVWVRVPLRAPNYGLLVLAGKYAVGYNPSEALVRFQRSPPSLCAGLILRVGFEAKRRQV